MKDVAFLEYTFMFNPVDTWQNLYQFEDQLAEFFKTKGLEANIVKTVAGQSGRRIMMISKIEEPVIEAKKPEKPMSVGDKMRKLQPK